MPPEIEATLAQGLLQNPVRVEVAPQGTTAAEIDERVVMSRLKQKRHVLSTMLTDPAMTSVLVFSRTKHGADRVTRDLERDGYNAAAIHGNKSRNAHQNALNGFKDGSDRILVARILRRAASTFQGLDHMIDFDLPARPRATFTASAVPAVTVPPASQSHCTIPAGSRQAEGRRAGDPQAADRCRRPHPRAGPAIGPARRQRAAAARRASRHAAPSRIIMPMAAASLLTIRRTTAATRRIITPTARPNRGRAMHAAPGRTESASRSAGGQAPLRRQALRAQRAA